MKIDGYRGLADHSKEAESMSLEKRVWEVMDSVFQTVTPETLLIEACSLMTIHSQEKPGTTALVVRRASGAYLGVLTVKDVLNYLNFLKRKALKEGKGEDGLSQVRNTDLDESLITVNDVLVRHDVYVQPNQELHEVIQIMGELDLELIPVFDAGKVIGVIRSSDILVEIAPKAKPISR